MELNLETDGIAIYKALASETRIQMLSLLANKPATASELAKQLNISKAIISRHLKELADVKLIHLSHNYKSDDERKKVYALKVDRININFPKRIYYPYKKKVHEIKLGFFSDFDIQPTCGLASATEIIGEFDDPKSFVSDERVKASLLWFSRGYVEYRIPNLLNKEGGEYPELLELSLELSSEFPISNNVWPSDITFSINGVEIGTWTCPGNFSDVRGKYTPNWWDSGYSQYGLPVHIRSNHDNTGIDGHLLSHVNIDDLNLDSSPFITLRIGVKDDAFNVGGVTIFGNGFGNTEQNILVTLYYSEHKNTEG